VASGTADALFTTGGSTNVTLTAQAPVGATGEALFDGDAATNVTLTAQDAVVATASALDPAVVADDGAGTTVNPGPAGATVDAYGPTGQVGAAVDAAYAAVLAADPALALRVSAGPAGATGTAYGAGEEIDGLPGVLVPTRTGATLTATRIDTPTLVATRTAAGLTPTLTVP
jgi:hypothetical protein